MLRKINQKIIIVVRLIQYDLGSGPKTYYIRPYKLLIFCSNIRTNMLDKFHLN